MATTLLLVRHAKAKVLAEGQADFDRELTEAGKRSLSATIGQQLSQFDTSAKNIQVWSSPAARAQQTAQIVVKGLKKAGVKAKVAIEDHESLWNQDARAFIEEVRISDADVVIAVGHNPMIEALAEQLTGARIPFSTGAIACISLDWRRADSPSPTTANETGNRLLWFSQGPISQHWKTLVQMEKTIRTCSNNVQSRLGAFLENPDDIETMHKFRVSIRTMRSLIAFMKAWQDPAQNTAMQADLKEVVGATSRLRELDVLCEQAAEAQGSSEMLIQFCTQAARDERKRVMDILTSKKTKKNLANVDALAHDVRWKRNLYEDGLPASDVRARFDQVAHDLESDLATLDLAEVERTHDVRKKAKRVRYVAENFKDMIGADSVAIAKGMTAHQDNLGAVCDARVNIDIINGFNSSDIPEPVAWDLALLRAKNETFLYTTLRSQEPAS